MVIELYTPVVGHSWFNVWRQFSVYINEFFVCTFSDRCCGTFVFLIWRIILKIILIKLSKQKMLVIVNFVILILQFTNKKITKKWGGRKILGHLPFCAYIHWRNMYVVCVLRNSNASKCSTGIYGTSSCFLFRFEEIFFQFKMFYGDFLEENRMFYMNFGIFRLFTFLHKWIFKK